MNRAEALCYSYHYLYGMDVTVLRYFTVYGPAGRPDMSLFRFVQWISEGRPVIVYPAAALSFLQSEISSPKFEIRNPQSEILHLVTGPYNNESLDSTNSVNPQIRCYMVTGEHGRITH